MTTQTKIHRPIGKTVTVQETRWVGHWETGHNETVTVTGRVLWSERSRGRTLYAIEGTDYLYPVEAMTLA